MGSVGRTAARRVRSSAQAVMRRTPRSAVPHARAVVLAWGKATAWWRMEPTIIVAGAQRAGTTTLFRLFEQHPNLVRPTASKATGYFADDYHQGRRWYRGHFPLARPSRGGQPRLTFEFGGYYMFHPQAPSRIARDLPDARVVVIVRDPVERAYSAHRHELMRGFDTLPFEQAIAEEDARTAGERERLVSDPTYVSYAHRHYSYKARSRYAEQIREMIDAVGDDRVYVMEADRFFDDPVGEFVALQRWLGLPVWEPENVERWNERPREPMSAELRGDLYRYFEPFDAELAVILGRPPVWRQRIEAAAP